MTIDELITSLEQQKEEVETEVEGPGLVETVQLREMLSDPAVALSMSLVYLQEVGNLLDRLTDKTSKKLTPGEMREIHKASDELFDFLNCVDVDPEAEGMERA